MIEKIDDIEITNKFWDCECNKFFINTANMTTYCSACHTNKEGQPNSRVNEVLVLFSHLTRKDL